MSVDSLCPKYRSDRTGYWLQRISNQKSRDTVGHRGERELGGHVVSGDNTQTHGVDKCWPSSQAASIVRDIQPLPTGAKNGIQHSLGVASVARCDCGRKMLCV